ncbi:sulfatase [Aeoliella sp.]|uniref:sulfatase n=1 Tax=Aeoliella sp. TaxID=2795800 RepID=UPI003CCBF24B
MAVNWRDAGAQTAGRGRSELRRRANFLLGVALVVILVGLAAECHCLAADRPNVLFIISDDLNTSLGCYGHAEVETPNLDQLAERGVRFAHAYCQYPLCGPSRNSMLTGLYPASTGILQNSQIFRQTIPRHHSLPQAFRLSGYFVGRIGKLYHYNVPNSIGTDGHDDPASWELELNPIGYDRTVDPDEIFSLRPGKFGATLSWYASPRSDEHLTDGMIADQADWVFERCAQRPERPFFLAVGFFRPHTPYISPQSYFDQYPLSSVELRQDPNEDESDIPPIALQCRHKEELAMSDDLKREATRAYYASVSFMDAQVGHVLDSLDRHGLTENTIVVFTSDHGYHLGEHRLWQKRSLFEESAGVPLIISAPGIAKAGSVANTPVGLIDLYPTLAQLCGVSTPDNLQGQDLAPILGDPNAEGRGWALTCVNRPNGSKTRFGYSLRTQRWRYTEWIDGNEGRELYDHQQDPREQNNLASDPEYSDTVAQLSGTLHQAIKTTFPPSGKTPEVRPGNWAPSLIP